MKAFVTVTEDLAMQQAEAADARITAGDVEPLTGVPMVLKDNMITKGVADYMLFPHAGELRSAIRRDGYGKAVRTGRSARGEGESR